MQVNLTVNVRENLGSDRYTQSDRYIRNRYMQVRLYGGAKLIINIKELLATAASSRTNRDGGRGLY